MTALAVRQANFWSYVERTPTCWVWHGPVNSAGYGVFGHHRDGETLVHRVSYAWAFGPIPEGLWIDHVRSRGCTSTLCVRPDHLEAVTPRENLLRGDTIPAQMARRTRCSNGHAFTEENTRMRGNTRECRACGRDRQRARRSRLVS